MNAKLLTILIVSAPLCAMDPQQKTIALADAFKAEKEFFDNEVNTWYKNIAQNIAIAAGDQKSDYAQVCKELGATDLRKLCSDPAITEQAKEYWHTISTGQILLEDYLDAYDAYQSNESLENRAKLFTKFRQTGAKKILELVHEKVSKDITSPNKEPKETFLQRKITANQHVELTGEQKIKYKALMVVQFGFRQIHRNADKKSDSANLLLPKEVTDQQKK